MKVRDRYYASVAGKITVLVEVVRAAKSVLLTGPLARLLSLTTTQEENDVRASDVTHYFPTSQNYYFFCKNHGSKRAERVENRVLGGVVVSASDIIEHCPHWQRWLSGWRCQPWRSNNRDSVTDVLPVVPTVHAKVPATTAGALLS